MTIFYKKLLQRVSTSWWKALALLISTSILIAVCVQLFFPFKIPNNYSTVIYDRNGEFLHAFLTNDDKWRMKTELDEISPLLKETIIYKEDKSFYYHPGIDLFSLARAFSKNIIRGKRTSGASTISMQLARLIDPQPRTYWNKFKEMIRAVQLEWNYSKDELLQAYINRLPYSGNIEGIKSASWMYFKKNPNHLSLAEIVTLTIIPNRPSSLVLGQSNDYITVERNRWLKKFAADKLFDATTIDLAYNEPLTVKRESLPRLAPHYARLLKRRPDYNINSTIHLGMQYNLEQMVSDYVNQMRLQGISQAAVVVIDNETHEILSYIGSADFFDDPAQGQVDGAKAIRQPGSTLKPFIYAMAIDQGIATPKSIITDVAVNFKGYTPENFDRKFNGWVTLEYALGNSLNIPAVKTLNNVGVGNFIQLLKDAGFKQVARDEKKLGLSVILGGCGSNLVELTTLYSTLANGGYYQPTRYTQEDSTHTGYSLWSDEASYMIHQTLTQIQRPDFPLHWQQTEKLPQIAWKTGTSYGRRDAWSIGYNQKYTVGVWLGNFNGTPSHLLQGATIATPLLFRIFNNIDYNSKNGWFEMPDGCDTRLVCAESGKIPTDECTQIVNDYFIRYRSSNAYCDAYETVYLNPSETVSYCQYCLPATGYKRKHIRKITPEMQHYFSTHGIMYEKIAPHNADCEIILQTGAPVINSLVRGEEYLLDEANPEPLLLSAQVSNDVLEVQWYVNDQFYRKVLAKEKIYFQPVEGLNKITCADDRGRTQTINIRVKKVKL
ncbi:penicillin-binding protein 1C [Gynurincola endophyticus]|uniref:penicillin-binding protein 1C n=1 Tax=Gynurincola endophyticus TaxID=2479004 RepID=UPI000F8DFB42|nr:penicillin-binding protein 1C [Gynurincola endophyticus]